MLYSFARVGAVVGMNGEDYFQQGKALVVSTAREGRKAARGSGNGQTSDKGTGLAETTCCHTFRATGITTYLENDGTIENAQQIAAHKFPRNDQAL